MLGPFEVLQSYRPHDGSLHDAFLSRLEHKAGELFLMQNGSTLSWSEFGQQYERLAAAFQARGTRKGDRVAVAGRNDLVHVLSLFALARLGAVMVPVNPDYGERELRYALQHAEVSGVVHEIGMQHRIDEAAPALDRTPWRLTWGDGGSGPHDTVRAAMEKAPPLSAGKPAAEDTCVIVYTSGTTGFPKGVMHSQRNFVTAGEANVARVHLQPTDRAMIILPFFHMNALFYSVGGVLAAGAAMIIEPRFSASRFWDTAADRGATVVNIIEAIGTILCARDRSEYRPDHRLRVVYGVRKRSAPIFRKDFGVQHLFSGFGMTEIPGVTCNPYHGPDKEGSMGVVGVHPDPSRPWAECRVVDDAGADVADNEVGELWVRTPIIMQGYFRDPEQTAAAFENGWFKTGDLVRRDEDGFYFHVSRKKDIIRRRGENIAAAELEMVIGEHPSVYQAAALAVPSELGEDDILTAVVAKDGSALSEEDIIDWCRRHLTATKVPRYVAILDALPLTPTHKIAKAVLRNDATLLSRAVDFQR